MKVAAEKSNHADRKRVSTSRALKQTSPSRVSFKALKIAFHEFEGHRQETSHQRGLQELANSSPLVQKISSYQEMANNSPRVRRWMQTQKMVDDSPRMAAGGKRTEHNKTGLPDSLKAGAEALSGLSLDDVKVHYDSPKPAQLQALATTQGADIHLGPGQERHLPHEAWHVVQQKRGLVRPIFRRLGVEINDDPALEHEASVMGEKAARAASATMVQSPNAAPNGSISRMLRSPAGNAVQRQIRWDLHASAAYKTGIEGLSVELAREFPHVDRAHVLELIRELDGERRKWTPFQAYQGIKNHLREKFPLPVAPLGGAETNITLEEAKWYFISNFKTFMEAIIDGVSVLKFWNTPDNNHAEDNMMLALDRLIEEKGWDEDLSGSHTLLIRINNSPCRRCAKRIYAWGNRDIFDELTVQFANMYEKTSGFTEATTRLRSGGIAMSLFSVLGNLMPLIATEETLKADAVAQRSKKDAQEAADWRRWQAADHGSSEVRWSHDRR